jgi:protoheme IX farnesyltransferase
MLPAIVPFRDAHVQMIAHTVALVISSLLVFVASSDLGMVYLISAVSLGAAFLFGTVRLGKNPTESASMRLFGFSITYITLLFAAMTVDVLL